MRFTSSARRHCACPSEGDDILAPRILSNSGSRRAPKLRVNPRLNAPPLPPIIVAMHSPRLTPVELEVARHALAGIAEEMGVALRRASYSPNIKERADCSAAVFDSEGQMVAQAEHIPVHLGAMPASVRAVLDTYGALRPGQQVCVNDPYLGGTHLPDLTIVAAVGSSDGPGST